MGWSVLSVWIQLNKSSKEVSCRLYAQSMWHYKNKRLWWDINFTSVRPLTKLSDDEQAFTINISLLAVFHPHVFPVLTRRTLDPSNHTFGWNPSLQKWPPALDSDSSLTASTSSSTHTLLEAAENKGAVRMFHTRINNWLTLSL